MPAITTGRVLITGANGFIAGWIAKTLLERGSLVRGTIRSAEKAARIREALSAREQDLEFVVVEDITKAGAFDDAVIGVDAIVHAASPVTLSAQTPDELIKPALEGTMSVLRSAGKPGSTIKRVVIISSLAAVVNSSRRTTTPAVYDETDWNDKDPVEVEQKGVDASSAAKYRTSKTLAERAAWEYVKEGHEKGTISWDLVSLCPPWVLGPALGARTPEDLTTSVGTWFKLAVKEEGEGTVLGGQGSWTDVRDFAGATHAVLIKPEAGGERFVISAGPFEWTQWTTHARRNLGKPGSVEDGTSKDVAYSILFDSKKSKAVLGIQYFSMEETAKFMIDDFKAKGWC
ncbi:NAD(P)-binding protein [Daedaleopsis nitida]|nr:NAD(P)-binding protein [Daedaleopsis nitida]